jgi:hypothetical protein
LLTPLLKSALADPASVSVIGSLIIQSCLQPGRGLQPIDASEAPVTGAISSMPPFSTVLNAFMQLPPEFILALALDGTGSHIFDAFVAAPCALKSAQAIDTRMDMTGEAVVYMQGD